MVAWRRRGGFVEAFFPATCHFPARNEDVAHACTHPVSHCEIVLRSAASSSSGQLPARTRRDFCLFSQECDMEKLDSKTTLLGGTGILAVLGGFFAYRAKATMPFKAS